MTSIGIVVLNCSGLVSLQDGGRRGYQRYGLSASGAMDPLAMAAANLLVGNAATAPALEFGLGGGVFRARDDDLRLAVAGAMGAIRIDDKPVIGSCSFMLPAGAVLTMAPPRDGAFGYLATAGGWQAATVLGSLSLHLRAGIGGTDGRPLRAGDILFAALAQHGSARALDDIALHGAEPIRVMLGPQDDHLSPEGLTTFLGSGFTVSHQADRMGYRLDGPAIAHGEKGYNIVSDGTAPGSIQLPGGGRPIVLMADRQTTGGYPKIATVISADLRRLAQRRPGDTVRFVAVSLAEAVAAARALAAEIDDLPRSLRDARAAEIDRLSGANLAGDAVDAFAAPW